VKNTKVIYEMQFVEQDPNLSFWVSGETISNTALYLISTFVPFAYILFLVFILLHGKSWKLRFIVFVWYTMGLIEIIFMTTALFETVKLVTGKLRPNFFAYCNYAGYKDALITGNWTYYYNNTSPGHFGSLSKCMANTADFQDSRKSFLSGHGSISFCGMLYTALLASSPFHPDAWYYQLRFLAFIPPLYLSSWIGITRIQDKQHYTEDVLAGALLGIFVAWWNFTTIQVEINKLKIKEAQTMDITLADFNKAPS